MNDTTVDYTCDKWASMLQIDINYQAFKEHYLNAYYCTISTKLRDFHYRLVFNAIVTNSKLYHWKIINSDLSTFCNRDRETIAHLLVRCPAIQRFCNNIKQFCMQEITLRDTLDFEDINIIFGTVHPQKGHIVNMIILLVKQYIHRCI